MRAAAAKRRAADRVRGRHPSARRLPVRRPPARRRPRRQVLASAAGDRSFDHRGLRDGDEVDLGGLTPARAGHTRPHRRAPVLPAARRRRAGRGVHRRVADRRRRRAHRPGRPRARPRSWPAPSTSRCSGWRTLPDATAVWPTHGAGSFCSAPPGAARTSTIGREKATNPLLAAPDEDAFVAALLGALGSYPPYFARLGELNRRGPALLDRPRRTLTAAAVPPGAPRCRLTAAPSWSTCARSPTTPPATSRARCRSRCAPSSPPGWAGSSPRHARSSSPQPRPGPRRDPLARRSRSATTDSSANSPAASPPGPAAGQPIATTDLVTPDADRAATRVLDVRQASEFADGHLPGAHLSSSVRLTAASTTGCPTRPTDGHVRARRTRRDRREPARTRRAPPTSPILDGGPEDWAAATGRSLDTGSMTAPHRPGAESALGLRANLPSSACSSRSTPSSAA